MSTTSTDTLAQVHRRGFLAGGAGLAKPVMSRRKAQMKTKPSTTRVSAHMNLVDGVCS